MALILSRRASNHNGGVRTAPEGGECSEPGILAASETVITSWSSAAVLAAFDLQTVIAKAPLDWRSPKPGGNSLSFIRPLNFNFTSQNLNCGE
jgi:hypothetical protein